MAGGQVCRYLWRCAVHQFSSACLCLLRASTLPRLCRAFWAAVRYPQTLFTVGLLSRTPILSRRKIQTTAASTPAPPALLPTTLTNALKTTLLYMCLSPVFVLTYFVTRTNTCSVRQPSVTTYKPSSSKKTNKTKPLPSLSPVQLYLSMTSLCKDVCYAYQYNQLDNLPFSLFLLPFLIEKSIFPRLPLPPITKK